MSIQIHETAIIDTGAQIGEGSRIWHWAHVCAGSEIGKGVSLGQNVFIGNKVIIGNKCKIQNNVSVYDNVTLEEIILPAQITLAIDSVGSISVPVTARARAGVGPSESSAFIKRMPGPARAESYRGTDVSVLMRPGTEVIRVFVAQAVFPAEVTRR